MTSKAQSSKVVGLDSIPADAGRRKRLGQYFTGDPLAELLVALADGSRCQSAIDPMCGGGDMLAAVRRASRQVELAGIEIDLAAYELCATRFARVSKAAYLINANAFSWPTISRLPKTSFDLVITNPPYVRYQRFASVNPTESGEFPQADDVRQGLFEIANNLSGLDERDRQIFISIIKGYSGLSDLAVPAWILCAMLTNLGGRLAMVVPESWLSRDYADPIHYLLLKFFRIRSFVEDVNRAWFDEAQVKTALMVAERVPRADNIWSACANQWYLQVAVPSSAKTTTSVIAGVFPETPNAESAFAEMLSALSAGKNRSIPSDLLITRCDLSRKLSDLIATSKDEDWFLACEPQLRDPANAGRIGNVPRIPQELLDLLPTGISESLTTIEALGAGVGQGLRTGANDFFYCELISETKDECLINPGQILRLPPLCVPREALRPVLRKQNEIGDGYVITARSLTGRVLILDRFAHPDNWRATNSTRLAGLNDGRAARVLMPPSLAALIDAAAQANVGTDENPKFIPQMSAVRTNQTKNNGETDAARYWYMLPQFTNRHVPDLLVPRVNYRHPKVVMNSSERVVVDANFSTIWLRERTLVNGPALLACLNSSWIIAAMELSAVVLGGGALKLEATHLKRLPIPKLSTQNWAKLSVLGHRLVSGFDVSRILTEIDQLVAQVLFGNKNAAAASVTIDRLKERRLAARKKR